MNTSTLQICPSAMQRDNLQKMMSSHQQVQVDISRADMIQSSLNQREAIPSQCGALATWNPSHSTGRVPKDTYMVKDETTQKTVDWSSNACIAMLPEAFDELWADAVEVLEQKKVIYETNRVIGADSSYALPVKVVTPAALTSLFVDNMFRDVPEDISSSIFADKEFQMIVLPEDRIQTQKYEGVLRSVDGNTVDMLVAMDFERRLGIVYGSRYCGAVKKLMFTVMNYLLPAHDMLPLHCSANEGRDGSTALFLGLSGTGKTTVSSDKNRALIGDDEHGWSSNGISNFENGCYAKMINLDSTKEAEIYNAVFQSRPYLEHGAIVENAMVYPNGTFDLTDDRFAENSRASYNMQSLAGSKPDAMGSHPKTIVFLTADAYGVLPPISKLDQSQAMLWFLMAYTSKLAGTEVGVTKPIAAFSRFFGEPFMPRHPQDYLDLLHAKLEEHGSQVYLVNTGWTGGPYGVGSRIDIPHTRAMVDAALQGDLDNVEFREDSRFHVSVPTICPGVPTELLDPSSTWDDKQAYEAQADELATKFREFFDVNYASSVSEEVAKQCPGK